jgi:Protein of unknown function (DUF3093)
MPADTGSHAPLFAERLSIPRRWWLITLVGVLVAGAEIFGGFGWKVAVVVYVALGVPMLALLIGMGRATVQVDEAGLHAGGQLLAATDMAGASVLDAQQTRLRLGPRADPRAHVVARGFIKQSVEVAALDERTVPYWLVSTRRPDELVEALRTTVLRARD